MYKRVMHERKSAPFREGINPQDITDQCTYHHEYVQGRVYDLEITLGRSTIIAPSRALMNFIKQWGVHIEKPAGSFQIDCDYENYKYSICTSATDKMPIFELNTRKAFKGLNELKKTIQGMQRISPTSDQLGDITQNKLLTALLMNDTTKAIQFLESYTRYSILEMLDYKDFRHYYKLVHPDTKFYTCTYGATTCKI